ncbi:HAD-superfamily phosphatase [Microthyrium microscopicum]|uniref:HAD-superfamily phosphatase n=1 Tax=Microthyrium microscopicum TaxID=703497 RepID=A0A6A6U4Q4_9PEZI|nr:HAD-superfamily phosphatase [Microthyrium microscopicum]
MTWLNFSGTVNAFRLLRDPSLCLPHHTVSTFNSLPIPLTKALQKQHDKSELDIRAVVLDKDNCFAVPHSNEVYEGYKVKFRQLREAYPGSKLLIVSNTAGTSSDKNHAEAALLEKNTGVAVLRHDTKKPGCHEEVMRYLRKSDAGVTSPSQVAIVGDRLLTDMMLANTMGSYGFWIRDGVKEAGIRPSFVSSIFHACSKPNRSQIARMEGRLATFLFRRRFIPQNPTSPFE